MSEGCNCPKCRTVRGLPLDAGPSWASEFSATKEAWEHQYHRAVRAEHERDVAIGYLRDEKALRDQQAAAHHRWAINAQDREEQLLKRAEDAETELQRWKREAGR